MDYRRNPIKNVKANPVKIGISKLSLIGKGKYSINMPKVAPAKAIQGETNKEPAKNAKKKPLRVPSTVFE